MANGVGIKLQPFTDAEKVANEGCGGAAAGDPGPSITKVQTYGAGSLITVEWDVTIAHPADNTNTGIRIAVKYNDTDSFAQNILAGPGSGTTVSAQSNGQRRNSVVLTLPPNKVSEDAVVQWMWAAQNDNGFYLGCSDVRIIQGTVPPTPPPTPSPTPQPGVTDAPTPAPAGIPTIRIELEILEGPRSKLADWSPDGVNLLLLDSLRSNLATQYNANPAQVTIATEAISKDDNLEAGVRVIVTVNYDDIQGDSEKQKAKDAINDTNDEKIAAVFARSLDVQGITPKITDWTMCNTGEKDGCSTSVKAESSTPVATFAIVALAVPIVAVGIILGLGGKKGRQLLLNGERS